MITCTVGVFAHNEAQNVRLALNALLVQQLSAVSIVEIIVMASGCTDATVEYAQEIARRHPLIKVDVETYRTGKAAAIRRLLRMARGEVVAMVGADTLPAPTAIEKLVTPFADPMVGMTGARVVPLNSPSRFMGFAVHMLWTVHHHLAMRRAKLGELVACRNILDDFPDDTSTDDLALEALISKRGYRLVYAPEAVVFNKGPESYGDFMLQRRRIFAGEMRIAFKYRYLASSLQPFQVLPIAIAALFAYRQFLHWTVAVIAMEAWARLLGALDTSRGKEPVVWRHAKSTKDVVRTSDSVTLVSVRWPPGTVEFAPLLGELRNLPESVASVFWWDRHYGEVLLRLNLPDPSVDWLQERLRFVPQEGQGLQALAGDSRISCHSIRFSSADSAR